MVVTKGVIVSAGTGGPANESAIGVRRSTGRAIRTRPAARANWRHSRKSRVRRSRRRAPAERMRSGMLEIP